MPYGEVRLIPGVNLERTPTLNEAGYSASQFIRFKDGLAQKYGGFQKFYPFVVGGVPRDLHVWADLNSVNHLSVGSTIQLSIITNGSLQNITPQTLTSNPSPNFTTTAGSNIVTINDPNINDVTTFDSVVLNTPVSVGGIVISGGAYPIVETSGATSYEIQIASPAVSSVSNGGVVPVFTTTSGSAVVSVNLPNHGLTGVAPSSTIVFPIATAANGLTVLGNYTITLTDANNFTITASSQANASSSFSMNSGNAQIVYYINLGPPPTGSGYGTPGGYGQGGFGNGVVPSSQIGTPITATNWTSDNWGEILMACPTGGGIYLFDPTGGFLNAGLVPGAPIYNGGMFVSISQQILLAWGSTATEGIGIVQDPLLIKWSDVGNFSQWTPLSTNQAGSFRIPVGSKIMGGAAVQNQNLFWTDLDLWAANYQGQPFVFGFNKIGSGSGAISSHSMQQLRGNVYWMGLGNFYAYDTNGVHVIPCPVWDFVFQNLNTAFQSNVRALPNTPFNEAGWAFPSQSSVSGENDSYVKFNITEPNGPWDVGPLNTMPRSAWTDQTVLGPPISASPSGIIYQQETTNDADGQPMAASFTTGYFYLAEGEEYAFVDQIIPDMKWTTVTGTQSAQVQLTFNVTNYPGDTPTSYGPYTVTSSTEYITTRFRGRQMSITVTSNDLGSFWRLGKCRYRYAPDGRR